MVQIILIGKSRNQNLFTLLFFRIVQMILMSALEKPGSLCSVFRPEKSK